MSACVIFGFFAVDVSKSVKTGLKSTGAVNVCLLAGASLKGKVPPPPTQPASLIAGLTEVGECPAVVKQSWSNPNPVGIVKWCSNARGAHVRSRDYEGRR